MRRFTRCLIATLLVCLPFAASATFGNPRETTGIATGAQVSFDPAANACTATTVQAALAEACDSAAAGGATTISGFHSQITDGNALFVATGNTGSATPTTPAGGIQFTASGGISTTAAGSVVAIVGQPELVLDTEIDTFAELDAIVADATLLSTAGIDSESELEAIVGVDFLLATEAAGDGFTPTTSGDWTGWTTAPTTIQQALDRVASWIATLVDGTLGIVIPNVALDRDGDGNPDYILCGDFDGDSTPSDLDIQSCYAALTDTGGQTLELVEGQFDGDLDNDGVGETGCSNPRNPHICIGSNTVLKGQGQGITEILVTPTVANEYGTAPIIGLDNSGDTNSAATTRSQNVHLSDFTAGTGVSTTEPDSGGAPIGVQLWDCDDCSVRRVTVHDTGHAAFHIARGLRVVGEDLLAQNCGSYDYDGVGGLAPGQNQPCLYLYSSDGVLNEGSGYRESRVVNGNTSALNLRTSDGILRGGPFGETFQNFNATQNRIAQVFLFDTGDNVDESIAGVGVEVCRVPGESPTGQLEVAIHTTSAGAPTGTAVTGYDFGDFEDVEADELTDACIPRFLRRTSTDQIDLTEGNSYALILRYTASNDTVRTVRDDTTADTYDDGDVYYGTTDTPSSLQTGIDLNFQIWTAGHVDPFYDNVRVQNVVGADSLGGSCLSTRFALRPRIVDVKCTDTEGVDLGQAGPVIDPTVEGASVVALSTSSTVNGIQVGQHCYGCEVRDSFVDVSRAGGSSIGVVLSPWSRNGGVRRTRIINSPNHGVRIAGGTRGATVVQNQIEGTLTGSGVALDQESDTDGVSGEVRSPVIALNAIRRAVYGVRAIASSAVIRGARIQNNSIEWPALNCLHLQMTNTSDDRFVGGLISGNLCKGWGADPGAGGTNTQGFFLDRSIKDSSIVGNRFETERTGTRAIDVRVDESGENYVITGNSIGGSESYQGGDEGILVIYDDAIDDGLQVFGNVGATKYKAPTGIIDGGDPNGAETAIPGAVYIRNDGGAGTTFYVAECADDFSGGGPPQTTGSPDGLCDSDGSTTAWDGK